MAVFEQSTHGFFVVKHEIYEEDDNTSMLNRMT